MRWRFIGFVLTALTFAFAMPVNAADKLFAPKKRVQVDLIADKAAFKPGSTVTLAIRQTIEPGWHTYWVNPGDSGEPTSVQWSLPQGFEAGPLQWPVPQAVPTGPLTNFGYEGTVLLLSSLKIPQEAAEGPVTIAGKVRLLVCADICIPEEHDVSLAVSVSEGATAWGAGASAIERTRRQLPVPLPGQAEYAAVDEEQLRLTAALPGFDLSRVKQARFFPLEWGHISNPAPQIFKVDGGTIRLSLKRGDLKSTPEQLKGVLALTEDVNGTSQTHGFELTAARTGSAEGGVLPDKNAGPVTGAADGGASARSPLAAGGGITLMSAAFFAFLGGIILNLMPCVFPVLALKALSFADTRVGNHRRHGLAYLAGVMASFAGLAAAVIALRETGNAFGWGFQFHAPEFVLALAVLFFALGLSLSGVFSIGGSLIAAGDGLTRKPGDAGYFFTGVLAVAAATPCTAPFMGAALGFALTQTPVILTSVFLALGLGFALPVVLLSVSRSFRRILPKPGAWMETFKQVLAFPLYATAGWLIWVLSIQTGSDGVMAAAVALTGVGFAAWLAGRTAMSGLSARLAAPVLAAAAIAFAVSLTPAQQEAAATPSVAAHDGSGPKAENYTAARLEGLVAQGKPVFVNLTAAWCITCKVNEKVALSSEAIARNFEQSGITYLKGDWTRQNPEITALLQRFGRAGVPLYLFYPGNGQPPRVLPQLLTESIILDEIASTSITASPLTKGA